MTNDLEHVPLPRPFPPARLLRRERGQVCSGLSELTLEQLHDVPVGDEVDVLKIVGQAFIGYGTSRLHHHSTMSSRAAICGAKSTRRGARDTSAEDAGSPSAGMRSGPSRLIR